MPEKPFWHVDLIPDEVNNISPYDQPLVDDELASASAWFDPATAELVKPTMLGFIAYSQGAPILTQYGYRTDAGRVPSAARVLGRQD